MVLNTEPACVTAAASTVALLSPSSAPAAFSPDADVQLGADANICLSSCEGSDQMMLRSWRIWPELSLTGTWFHLGYPVLFGVQCPTAT